MFIVLYVLYCQVICICCVFEVNIFNYYVRGRWWLFCWFVVEVCLVSDFCVFVYEVNLFMRFEYFFKCMLLCIVIFYVYLMKVGFFVKCIDGLSVSFFVYVKDSYRLVIGNKFFGDSEFYVCCFFCDYCYFYCLS